MTAITDDQLDLMMRKWDAWVARFVWNSTTKHQQRITKPTTTEQTTRILQFLARRSQDRSLNTTKFEEDKLQLNLQKNTAGIFKCRGCIQGVYPIYLPIYLPYLPRSSSCMLTSKLCMGRNSKVVEEDKE